MNISVTDKLITQYCSDGVEYKELWELTYWDKRFNGVEKEKQKKVIKYPYLLANDINALVVDNGDVRILSTGIGEIKYTTEELAGNNLCKGEIVAIPWGGTPNIKYYKGKFVTGDNRIATSNDTNILNNKFLYYYLSNNIELISSFYRGAGIQHPSMKAVLSIKIPVPSLSVQEEIVKILDSYSELEAELESKLEAEIDARKKQYKYHLNQLLSFEEQDKNVKFMQLGEIGTFIKGNGLQKKDFTDSGVGCIHYGQIYTYYGTYTQQTKSFVSEELAKKLKKAQKGDLIIATTSENVEDVGKAVAWLGNESICIGGHSTVFHHNQNPKYMAYLFQTEIFFKQKQKVAKGVKVIDISDKAMSKFKFGFPSIEEQERTVAILDEFNKLTNEISYSLQAEIDARKKQYEFYRNKLLTFKEAV